MVALCPRIPGGVLYTGIANTHMRLLCYIERVGFQARISGPFFAAFKRRLSWQLNSLEYLTRKRGSGAVAHFQFKIGITLCLQAP